RGGSDSRASWLARPTPRASPWPPESARRSPLPLTAANDLGQETTPLFRQAPTRCVARLRLGGVRSGVGAPPRAATPSRLEAHRPHPTRRAPRAGRHGDRRGSDE